MIRIALGILTEDTAATLPLVADNSSHSGGLVAKSEGEVFGISALL